MLALIAEAAADAAESGTPFWTELMDSGAMKFMIEGGLFMWPILFCGIMAAAVIIERFRSLLMLASDDGELRKRVVKLLEAKRPEEALDLCESKRGPVAAVLGEGLRKYIILKSLDADPALTEQQADKAMEDYGAHIVASLERHLPILATVASVAPMLGFLGTVQGMVLSFQDLVDAKKAGGFVDIVIEAAAGIKVALLTTVFGLVVGIPAFTAYNYFATVINRCLLEVEEAATDLVETLTFQSALSRKAGIESNLAETQVTPS